jgi:hypothetical protein
LYVIPVVEILKNIKALTRMRVQTGDELVLFYNTRKKVLLCLT